MLTRRTAGNDAHLVFPPHPRCAVSSVSRVGPPTPQPELDGQHIKTAVPDAMNVDEPFPDAMDVDEPFPVADVNRETVELNNQKRNDKEQCAEADRIKNFILHKKKKAAIRQRAEQARKRAAKDLKHFTAGVRKKQRIELSTSRRG